MFRLPCSVLCGGVSAAIVCFCLFEFLLAFGDLILLERIFIPDPLFSPTPTSPKSLIFYVNIFVSGPITSLLMNMITYQRRTLTRLRYHALDNSPQSLTPYSRFLVEDEDRFDEAWQFKMRWFFGALATFGIYVGLVFLAAWAHPEWWDGILFVSLFINPLYRSISWPLVIRISDPGQTRCLFHSTSRAESLLI